MRLSLGLRAGFAGLSLLSCVFCGAARPTWAAEELTKIVIDDMRSPENYSTYADPSGSVIRLRSIEGETPEEKALEITYEFRKGWYVLATKHGSWDLSGMKEVKVRLKGSGYEGNFEIKFIDDKGVAYMQKRENDIAVKYWHELTFKKEDFYYTFGGVGDKTINWEKIQSMDLVVGARENRPSEPLTVLISSVDALVEKKGPRKSSVIDNFESYQPINRYKVRSSPDSSMTFNRTANTFESQYSLEMTYYLGDVNSDYSWTRIEAITDKSLNWVTVDKIRFNFLGDGSGNHLQFFVEDLNGRIMAVPLDRYLKDDFWQTLEIKREDFKSLTDKEAEWHQLRTFGLMVRSNPGQLSSNKGRIYMEKIQVRGEKLASDFELSPWGAPPQEFFLKNFSFYGWSLTEYYRNKHQAMSINQMLPLTIFGNFNQFSFNLEVSAAYTPWGGSGTGGFLSKTNPVESGNLKISLHRVLPGVELVELGNLWVDLSKHLFSTNSFINNVSGFTWGLKGIRAYGWFHQYGLNHDTYLLKHGDNSYTLANKSLWEDPILGLKVSNLVVDYHREPFSTLGSEMDMEDLSDLMEFSCNLPGKLPLNIQVRGGINYFKKIDRGLSAFYTQTSDAQGTLLETELSLKNVLESPLDLLLGGRRVDPDFKPFYREKPWFYDFDVSDQNEGRVRATVHLNPVYNPYLEAEYLQRRSNENFSRKTWKLGADVNVGKMFNTTVEAAYRDDNYFYSNPLFADKGDGYNLANNDITWRAFWKTSIYLVESLQVGFEYAYSYIYDRWDNFYTDEQELMLRANYYVSNNSTLSLEHSFKKYRVYERYVLPAETEDPTYDRNYTKVSLRLNF